MKIDIKKSARRLAGVLAASAVCASASAIDFTFSQGGFAEGASLTGSFSGSDDDLDGFLTYDVFGGLYEITQFSLSFSGNSLVSAFSMGLPELQALSFKLDGDSVLGNDLLFVSPYTAEGLVVANSDYILTVGDLISYEGSPIIESATNYDLLDKSLENPITQQVPDAGSSAALLGGAMLGLFGLGRRFRAKR